MASTGFTLVGTGINVAGLGVDWANPTNITSDNGSAAQASLSNFATSDYLCGYNCGFALPDCTINGIEIKVDVQANAQVEILYVNPTKDAENPVGTSESSYPLSGSVPVYGTSTALWGTTWTRAEVNATTFGATLLTTESADSIMTFEVDAVWINVHYTETAPWVPETNADETIRIVSSGARWM